MDKYDTSQLTEFPRYEPESTQSGVSTFFNKLWKFPIFSPNESSDNMQTKALEYKQNAPQSEEQSKQEYDDMKPETASYAVEFEGRSLPNVLKRISSLVALGSGVNIRNESYTIDRHYLNYTEFPVLMSPLLYVVPVYAYNFQGGTRYADTELARYWMPDDISRECYECATRFSALRRRHHCRVCGQIFCSRCCSQRVPGSLLYSILLTA